MADRQQNIQRYSDSPSEHDTDVSVHQADQTDLKSTILREMTGIKSLLSASLETSIYFFLCYIPSLITLFFITKNSTEDDSRAFGLGIMWTNSLGYSIFYGLSCALETLVSHAYGAKLYQLAGIMLQRTIAIMLVLFIPIFIIMLFSGSILRLWNQDDVLCDLVSRFTFYNTPSILFNGVYLALTCFMNGQCEYRLQVYTTVLGVVFHIGTCFLFIEELKMGLDGAALVTNLYQLFIMLIMWFLIKATRKAEHTLIDFTTKAFKDWKKFLSVALPIGSLISVEWMTYQMFTLLASTLPQNQLSAQVILITLSSVFVQFPEGISIAITTFVGNQMGKACHLRAKSYAQIGVILTGIVQVIIMGPLYFFSDYWVTSFTDDPGVRDIVTQMIPLFVFLSFCDAAQVAMTGISRGIAKEKFACYSFFASYVFLGFISAMIFSHYFGLEIYGIWIGQSLGLCVYTALQIYICMKEDWEQLGNQIRDRLQEKQNQDGQGIKIAQFIAESSNSHPSDIQFKSLSPNQDHHI